MTPSDLREGDPAPDFTLLADDGSPVTLSSFRGRQVVLYFYPNDDTPGCSTQACGIRDAWDSFETAGAVVLGISSDDERSHAQFKSKLGLPFTLLADPDHRVCETYGVWVEYRIDGKPLMAAERSTFVIDERGVVKKIMRKVDPELHAGDVLAALAA